MESFKLISKVHRENSLIYVEKMIKPFLPLNSYILRHVQIALSGKTLDFFFFFKSKHHSFYQKIINLHFTVEFHPGSNYDV